MKYNLFDVQLDSGIYLDDGYHFDSAGRTFWEGFGDIGISFTMEHRLALRLSAQVEIAYKYTGVRGIDLLPLIPQKFHQSQMLVDYIDSVNVGVGSMLQGISDLKNLLNPRLVGADYLGQLANLLGYKFIGEDLADTEELRRQLIDAIPFFKIKGTYDALQYIGYLCGVDVNIYDMYSDAGWSHVVDSTPDNVVTTSGAYVVTDEVNPYTTFVKVPWFAAHYEEENPEGLGDTWFKTPHFGFEIQLKKYFNADYVEPTEKVVNGGFETWSSPWRRSNADIIDEQFTYADTAALTAGGWTDSDGVNGVSSMASFDGGTHLKLDGGTPAASGSHAVRNKDIGACGTRTVLSYRLYLDNMATTASDMHYISLYQGTYCFVAGFWSSGLYVYNGTSWIQAGSSIATADDWFEIMYDIDWTSRTVDVYKDGTLVASAMSCDYALAGLDGHLLIVQRAFATAGMISYVDWLTAGSTFNAPLTSWTLGGTDAVIERESTVVRSGTYSAKLTKAGYNIYLYQSMTIPEGITYWIGKTITWSCYVWSDTANRVRLRVGNGVGTTLGYSSYHIGDSTWQLLTVTFEVDLSSIAINCFVWLDGVDGSVYVDDASIVAPIGMYQKYLWKDERYPMIPEAIELVRPINTVPHITGLLVARTKEDGKVQIISETQVATCVTDQWQYTSWNFDNGQRFDSYEGSAHSDPQLSFDQSLDVFLNAITEFSVGTGNKNKVPTHTGFTLETPVYTTGVVTGYERTSEGYVFNCTMPAGTEASPVEYGALSELVLCLTGGIVIAACTFPDTDKTNGMELTFKIIVSL